MTVHVKGKRRKLVEKIHDTSADVLAAQDLREAYLAYAELGWAIDRLYEHLKLARDEVRA